MSADLQPDELDALQAEDTSVQAAVLVKHDGPVRIQDLPRKAAGSRTRTVTTAMTKMLGADHRRAQARFVVTGNPVYVAFSSASAQDPSTCGIWPVGLAYTMTADSELWIGSTTATAVVSLFTEFWATGE